MTTQTIDTDHGQANAKAWLGSIEEMLDAPYETAATAEGWSGPFKDEFKAAFFRNTDGTTWACSCWQKLCEEHDIDAEMTDDQRQTIEESVLSVSVRDGWHQPGAASEDGPEEYEILLSTGGPALRIYGRLDQYCQPHSAELQYQDWGTPWTRFPAPEATLLAFAAVFYFGE